MEFSSCGLHLWRLIAAVTWSILAQFVILCSYITVMSTDMCSSNLFFMPFASILSAKCLYIIPLAAIIFFQGVVCSRDYIKPPKSQFINKRFLILFGLFSYQNFVALCMFVTLGFFITYVYSSLSKESISSLSTKCSNNSTYIDDVCLNEKKLFLILAGVWIGLYSFIKDYIYSTKTLNFPPIQQRKFIRIKAAIFPCLRKSVMSSLFPSVIFCILYYFKGHLPRSYVCLLFGFVQPQNLLDTVFIILDFELMLYLWSFISLYVFSLEIMTVLFNVYLTERAYFLINTAFMCSPNADHLLLQDALAAEKIPIIQHLGALDLVLLSHFDFNRRAELFMLSQPGGHPHSWNAIINECFKIIDKFTDQLDKCINVPAENAPKDDQNIGKSSNLSSHSCHHRSHNMRNLAVNSNIEYVDQSPAFALQKSYERFLKVYNEWLDKKMEAFWRKPFIAYFFGEMNEPKIKHLLFQSQLVIWAVESLSVLICHSVKEDSFGVAQKDLPKIIESLLHLKISLEKLQKQSVFIKKSNKLDLYDLQIKNALKVSVKQSIYRIAIHFKDFIHDINLNPVEFNVLMMNYVEFREI